jgi:hypothetical protein
MRRTKHVLAARYERHHYTTTAHTDTVALRSNSGETIPGQQSADPTGNAATIRDYPGYQRADRTNTGWARNVNTNTQLSRGGISCYPKPGKEIGYGYAR